MLGFSSGIRKWVNYTHTQSSGMESIRNAFEYVTSYKSECLPNQKLVYKKGERTSFTNNVVRISSFEKRPRECCSQPKKPSSKRREKFFHNMSFFSVVREAKLNKYPPTTTHFVSSHPLTPADFELFGPNFTYVFPHGK